MERLIRWLRGKVRFGRVTLIRRSSPVSGPVRRRLRKWPEFWRNFTLSFLVGCFIAVLILIAGSNSEIPLLENTQRWVRDKCIAVTRYYRQIGIIDSSPLPSGISGFVFLDIDDATWRNPEWGGGEPPIQPRQQVLKLVDQAFENGAKFVFLDVTMDGPSRAEDMDWLARFVGKAYGPGDGRYLFVARSLRAPIDPHKGTLDMNARPTMRPAFWDAYRPRDGAAHIQSVLPMFHKDSDLRVRDWEPGMTVFSPPDGASRYFPSPQLALYCYQRGLPGAASHKELEPLCPLIGTVLDQKDAPGAKLSGTVLFGLGMEGRLGYSRLPVGSMLHMDTVRELPGSIAILGASFLESGDHHVTPIGELPGSLLATNAMDTMLRYGQLHELPMWAKMLLAMVNISIVAAVLATVHRMFAYGFATVLVIVVFGVAVGPWLLMKGWWFDFGTPLVGIQLHKFFQTLFDEGSRGRKSNDMVRARART